VRGAAFGLALLLIAGAARAADLVVEIEGVRSGNGDIHLGLYNSAATWLDDERAVANEKTAALRGTTRLVFRDLPPGTYALALYHDENGNGEFDTNFLGIPREGYAISNDVHPVLSAPSFAEAAFTLPAEGRTLRIAMIYW
jgi:uncharacterized protein (DUF2141 family)